MTTTASRRISPKRTAVRQEDTVRAPMLTGNALLEDMEAYGRKLSATPEAARDFLGRLGVLTADGKRKRLIRG